VIGFRSRKHVRRLAASAAFLAVSILPAVTAGSAAVAVSAGTTLTTATSATGPATVTLTSITPAVAVPGTPITFSGTVRNTGSVRIDSPMVRVLIGDRGLTTRGAVSDWATPGGQQRLVEVARIATGQSLTPGAEATFTVVVPATAISHQESFAVLPVSVDLVGTAPEATSQNGSLGGQHTFLPTLSAIKRYEPISISWLVPLTLDADPSLHGMDSELRAAAWAKAIGPGSRLDRLITSTDSTKVTWAIDPALLGPPTVPNAGGASTTSPTTGTTPTPSADPAQGQPSSPDPVVEATTALASRLRDAAPRHTLWSLPYADPDLAALLPLASGKSAVKAMIGHPSALDAAVGPTRKGIAWPVDGRLGALREARLRAAYSSSGLAAAVISTSSLANHTGLTDNASRKSTGGLPILAYDQSLSRTFAQTSAAPSGPVTIQRFLADSMALLGERPGTQNRSVLVAAPRTFAGDPSVLSSFFAAVATAPWLTPTTTDELLAAAGAAAPELPAAAGPTAAPRSLAPPATAVPSAPDPLSAGASPLSEARLRQITKTTSAVVGVASISNDASLFRVRWTDAQEQQLSSRWRAHRVGSAALDATTQMAITNVSRHVHVVPSSVNFFADRGVLQVTVVNDLAVPVHDVRLTLIPGQPRLRIDEQPGLLRIGAKSRTNVKLSVTAIAAGLVPVEAVLTTANGTSLGQNARVNVRVQPTSTWLYPVLGGLASIILVLGVYRSLRRGSTRASHPAAQELHSHV
jgi:hypothetical protein